MNMNSYNCCDSQTKENKQILSQLSLIKLLADKNRLQLLCILNTESHAVNDLVSHLGVSQSLVSHHLIALKDLALVEAQKNGRQVFYSLSSRGKNVIQLLKILSSQEK